MAQYKVLHSFGSGTDGGGPSGSVSMDKQGRVFGSTSGGGPDGYGIVFKLSALPNGRWKESVLHSFANGDPNGSEPNGGLIQGQGGHWYGTTWVGGAFNSGTVFELRHTPTGWKESVLYSFGAQSDDGSQPASGLVMDSAGDLYGTAAYGGSTAFELSAGPDGWSETILHHFGVESGDGAAPFAGFILDASGNLYGTTQYGGQGCVAEGCGTVYKLKPLRGGGWKEIVLHRFNNDGKDGVEPGPGALLMDSAGNLYGTTEAGGRYGWGIAFRLIRDHDGTWKEKILHNFNEGKGGAFPGGGVVMDAAGNLYGTAVFGGTRCDCGVIYKLSPGPNDTWTYSVLHRFQGTDGAMPAHNLVFDEKGNLYGVTSLGGDYGAGVVFELTP